MQAVLTPRVYAAARTVSPCRGGIGMPIGGPSAQQPRPCVVMLPTPPPREVLPTAACGSRATVSTPVSTTASASSGSSGGASATSGFSRAASPVRVVPSPQAAAVVSAWSCTTPRMTLRGPAPPRPVAVGSSAVVPVAPKFGCGTSGSTTPQCGGGSSIVSCAATTGVSTPRSAADGRATMSAALPAAKVPISVAAPATTAVPAVATALAQALCGAASPPVRPPQAAPWQQQHQQQQQQQVDLLQCPGAEVLTSSCSTAGLRCEDKLFDEEWWYRHLEDRRQGGAPPDQFFSSGASTSVPMAPYVPASPCCSPCRVTPPPSVGRFMSSPLTYSSQPGTPCVGFR
mmetsp:Transcript_42292/g.106589  ORF Transcript_42292/g.106589 Transcript_42292/m.106589 type:complete len:344 (-) Transcript_42292:55-1086(-)